MEGGKCPVGHVQHLLFFNLTALKSFIKQSRGCALVLMCCHLRKLGLSINYKRFRRIMQDNGLYHRYHHKHVKTADSEHRLDIRPKKADLI